MPRPDPPAEGYTNKVVMNVSGKRFELTCRVEARESTSLVGQS